MERPHGTHRFEEESYPIGTALFQLNRQTIGARGSALYHEEKGGKIGKTLGCRLTGRARID